MESLCGLNHHPKAVKPTESRPPRWLLFHSPDLADPSSSPSPGMALNSPLFDYVSRHLNAVVFSTFASLDVTVGQTFASNLLYEVLLSATFIAQQL